MTAGSSQFAGKAVARDYLDLVHATQHGDVSAFEQLVGRYDHKLLRIAQYITHNREDSEDAVQESVLKAFQHLGEFREDAQFSTLLIRITVNESLTKLRKRRTTKEVSLDEDFRADEVMLPGKAADWAPNPEELYRAFELREILINALEELRPILRTMIVLRDIEGFSTDQMADILDLTPAAVKVRLFRARLELRKLLSRYFSKHQEPDQVELARDKPPCKIGFEQMAAWRGGTFSKGG